MEPIGALRAGFAQGNRRRERQGADRAIKRLDSPGCEVHVATMTAAQAPAMVANPLFDTEDPEMIREVLRRLARRLNTVAPSPEATRPRTPRRRSPGSSLPALVAACRQLLRMAKEIGALSSPEVARRSASSRKRPSQPASGKPTHCAPDVTLPTPLPPNSVRWPAGSSRWSAPTSAYSGTWIRRHAISKPAQLEPPSTHHSAAAPSLDCAPTVADSRRR